MNLPLVPFLTAVGGLAIYLLLPGVSSPPTPTTSRIAEAGRIAFFVGLLWLIAENAGRVR